MRTQILRNTHIALAAAIVMGMSSHIQAAPGRTGSPTKNIDCHMQFALDGWSAAYMTAHGSGTVTCSDGKSMPVTLDAKGGGLSAGAFKIKDGRADFTDAAQAEDVLGSYGAAKAHIGAAKTAQGAVMTNGKVSAAFGGTGDGWDIGIGFEKFTITKAASK